jgi:hypothetical protein
MTMQFLEFDRDRTWTFLGEMETRHVGQSPALAFLASLEERLLAGEDHAVVLMEIYNWLFCPATDTAEAKQRRLEAIARPSIADLRARAQAAQAQERAARKPKPTAQERRAASARAAAERDRAQPSLVTNPKAA